MSDTYPEKEISRIRKDSLKKITLAPDWSVGKGMQSFEEKKTVLSGCGETIYLPVVESQSSDVNTQRLGAGFCEMTERIPENREGHSSNQFKYNMDSTNKDINLPLQGDRTPRGWRARGTVPAPCPSRSSKGLSSALRVSAEEEDAITHDDTICPSPIDSAGTPGIEEDLNKSGSSGISAEGKERKHRVLVHRQIESPGGSIWTDARTDVSGTPGSLPEVTVDLARMDIPMVNLNEKVNMDIRMVTDKKNQIECAAREMGMSREKRIKIPDVIEAGCAEATNLEEEEIIGEVAAVASTIESSTGQEIIDLDTYECSSDTSSYRYNRRDQSGRFVARDK